MSGSITHRWIALGLLLVLAVSVLGGGGYTGAAFSDTETVEVVMTAAEDSDVSAEVLSATPNGTATKKPNGTVTNKSETETPTPTPTETETPTPTPTETTTATETTVTETTNGGE
jgi:predicted ribosomally synthesized peptide with SipW-like signal peptide